MAQILDTQQDLLFCSQCQNYLSVFPVKNYKDGSIKCGRCTRDNDEGVVSAYEILAKHCLFKCINRYNGCRKLLFPSLVAEHEKQCVGKRYSCPKCPTIPQMPSLQLIQHFKSSHNDQFLTSNNFYLTLSSEADENTYMYVENDNVFVIYVKYIPRERYLWLSAVILHELDHVEQQYTISVNSLAFKETSSKEKCLSLDTFKGQHYCKLKTIEFFNKPVKVELVLDIPIRSYELQVSPEEPKATKEVKSSKYHSTSTSLVQFSTEKLQPIGEVEYNSLFGEMENGREFCPNCKQFLEDLCNCDPDKHFLWDCKVWCSLCDESVQASSKEGTSLCKHLSFSCKLKCDSKNASNMLEYHEVQYNTRRRECPICYVKVPIQNFVSHMRIFHDHEISEYFDLTDFLEKHEYSSNVVDYFIMHNYTFKIECKRVKLLEKPRKTIASVLYFLHISPCEEVENLELFVLLENACSQLENGEIIVKIEDRPQFYIGCPLQSNFVDRYDAVDDKKSLSKI